MKPPEHLVTPITVNDKSGNEQEIGRLVYVLEHTTTRDKTRTVYGDRRPVCERCGYGIGDSRWEYCPKCGARIVEEGE